jgi:hypothetical protein
VHDLECTGRCKNMLGANTLLFKLLNIFKTVKLIKQHLSIDCKNEVILAINTPLHQ